MLFNKPVVRLLSGNTEVFTAVPLVYKAAPLLRL